MTLFYRGTISILMFIFHTFLFWKFISFENIDLIILFSVLILVQWINEMNLVVSEVRKKTFLFKIYSVVNLVSLITGTFFYILVILIY